MERKRSLILAVCCPHGMPEKLKRVQITQGLMDDVLGQDKPFYGVEQPAFDDLLFVVIYQSVHPDIEILVVFHGEDYHVG